MAQLKTYERRRIDRKHNQQGEGAASEEIGSRIFPLPTPVVETMLTVARKSSTRVFVRKAISGKHPGKASYSAKIFPSVKRPWTSEPVEKAGGSDSEDFVDIRFSESNEKVESRFVDRIVPDSCGIDMAAPDVLRLGKMFENVYSRKRQRIPSISSDSLLSSSSNCSDSLPSSSSNGRREANDLRFRVVFSRKQKRKIGELNGVAIVRGRHQFEETENLFRTGVRSDRLLTRELNTSLLEAIDACRTEFWTNFTDPVMLVLLLESSSDDSLFRFRRLLISVFTWMKKTRMNLHCFTAFLLSTPINSTFRRHGIHFAPLVYCNSNFFRGNFISNFGACEIYCPRESVLLLSLNFRALPSYFMNLHLVRLFRSQYLPFSLSTYLLGLNKKQIQDTQRSDFTSQLQEEADFSKTSVSIFANPARETSAAITQSNGNVRGSMLMKFHRRSFPTHSKFQKISSIDRNMCTSENGDIYSLNSLYSKLTKNGKKSHGDIKQSIDSVRCNANVLVTVSDRSWREEGAEVLLETSSSGDLCIAVKIGSNLRCLYRPYDLKYALNRFTHAYMWFAEDGWRIEFPKKNDWLTFKKLHAECRQFNNQHREDAYVKLIPVPVFKGAAFEDAGELNFERPEQYIHMKHVDEILRALASEVPYYDMDSEDDEWLKQQTSIVVSEESFERMIFTFEKNAYYSSSQEMSSERELHNYEDLRTKDMVADVFDYWLKKRKQKRAPLVRVFQGLSLRKPHLMQRQVLRKRRSLKRLRSQNGRGKPACWFDSKAKLEAKAEALLKIEEAENALRRSTESAVVLRRRAQLLMENADLAAYKSVMALRIYEAIKSMPDEVTSSSIFDYLPENMH